MRRHCFDSSLCLLEKFSLYFSMTFSISFLALSRCTARKVSKYGVISGPYFPVFSPITGKCGREITPYLDTFHAVVTFVHKCIFTLHKK